MHLLGIDSPPSFGGRRVCEGILPFALWVLILGLLTGPVLADDGGDEDTVIVDEETLIDELVDADEPEADPDAFDDVPPVDDALLDDALLVDEIEDDFAADAGETAPDEAIKDKVALDGDALDADELDEEAVDDVVMDNDAALDEDEAIEDEVALDDDALDADELDEEAVDEVVMDDEAALDEDEAALDEDEAIEDEVVFDEVALDDDLDMAEEDVGEPFVAESVADDGGAEADDDDTALPTEKPMPPGVDVEVLRRDAARDDVSMERLEERFRRDGDELSEPRLSGVFADTNMLKMIKRERARQWERERAADQKLTEAEAAARNNAHLDAMRLFSEARTEFNALPAKGRFAGEIVRARRGLADAQYEVALIHFSARDLPEARAMAKRALLTRSGHGRSERLLEKISKEEERRAKLAEQAPPPTHRKDEKDFVDKGTRIANHLRRGRQHQVLGEYDLARKSYEAVLAEDPHHRDAIALRARVERRIYDLRTEELLSTQESMMRQVREAWRPADYVRRVPQEATGQGPVETDDNRLSVVDKMQEIIIPEMEFRQANIHVIVQFLVEASRNFAPTNWTTLDRARGITIILNVNSPEDTGGAGDDEAASDPFAIDDDPLDGGRGVGGGTGLTLSARYISLFQALKLITEVANLKYRIDEDIVMIVDADAPDGDIIVRTYPVQPNFMERVAEISQATSRRSRGGGAGPFIEFGSEAEISEGEDLSSLFKDLGVPFPKGSSIKYVSGLAKLFVANTANNLTLFERVLKEINVVPKQIEIEARFVDISQTDLSELGLEWLLTDDYEVAVKREPAAFPPASRGRIVIPRNAPGGFTKSLRFLGDEGGVLSPLAGGLGDVGDLLAIQSVFTNPELTMILHALERSGNANVLSAPKVLTQAGEEATIKVVKEFIYPTEFEQLPVVGISDGISVNLGTTVTPSAFETREVGVILTVLPEISPEGHLITLVMTPQVVEGPEFIDYGSSVTLPDGTVNTVSIQQPIFFTREVTTRVIIYDGSTVVMGGMITEALTTTDDKIPILGDLPLIGPLFRSKTSNSQKRNLLIFVTARLVDPAGKPLGDTDVLLDKIIGGSAE